MRPSAWHLIFTCVFLTTLTYAADQIAFWPQFHGPNRDNISTEKGLLKRWPVNGPPLLWTSRGLGHGYSSISIANGMIYTLSIDGLMGLVQPTPVGHKLVSYFKIPRGGKGKSWAHPVVCGGRLYIRHGEFLYAYSLR